MVALSTIHGYGRCDPRPEYRSQSWKKNLGGLHAGLKALLVAVQVVQGYGPCKFSHHLLYINHCKTGDIHILRLGTRSWT